MALAHFHAGIVSRSYGRSAVEAAAYVMRMDFRDLRTGESHSNSRNAADAVQTFVWLPKGAPEQYRDGEALANYMEARETRKNSQTARTFEGALPHELTDKQREQLVKNFAQELTRKGLAVIVGIHKPHAQGDERDHRLGVVVSTRTMDAQGLGAKDRDSNSRDALMQLRQRFEVLTNSQLERAGHAARIDMRSLEEQGIAATPQVHMGPAIAAMERQGIQTSRGDLYRAAKAEREQAITWTEGKPRAVAAVPELVPVVSAAERQLDEDRKTHEANLREAARQDARSASVPFHLRMMAQALRFLRVSNGSLLESVMGRVDRATVSASLREERADQIRAARDARADDDRRRDAMAAQVDERNKAKRMAQAQAEAAKTQAGAKEEISSQPPPPPASRQIAQDEARTFVDRGRRPSRFRALVGELRGESEQEKQPSAAVWSHEAARQAQDVVRDRDAGETTSSQDSRSTEAKPARRLTYAEELRQQQAAKGQTLADLLPKDYRERQRQREREEGLGLDLEL